MADYVVHVHTPLDQATAFAYMADLTNIADWDPGVIEAKRVPAGPFEPGIGTMFKKIGDRAANGLIEALDGRRVDSEAAIQALTDRA